MGGEKWGQSAVSGGGWGGVPQASLGAEGEELLAAAGGTESLCAGLEARASLYLGHVQDLPE